MRMCTLRVCTCIYCTPWGLYGPGQGLQLSNSIILCLQYAYSQSDPSQNTVYRVQCTVYNMCVHCVHELCTCTVYVYVYCKRVLCTCTVYVDSVRGQCTCTVYVYCVRVLYTSTVVCVRLLCTVYVYVYRVRVPCACTVYVYRVSVPCTAWGLANQLIGIHSYLSCSALWAVRNRNRNNFCRASHINDIE